MASEGILAVVKGGAWHKPLDQLRSSLARHNTHKQNAVAQPNGEPLNC